MSSWQTVLLSVTTTLIASSGFWTYLLNRRDRRSASTRLLMGLAHDKILFLGMKHVQEGYITRDEYEDLRHYLYDPYIEAGGNGTVERVMIEVSKLPLIPHRIEVIIEGENEHETIGKYRPKFRTDDQ